MLDLTGDTTCDIHLWMHCHTGLANLAVVVYPSCVNSRTAGAHLSVEFLGELE